MKTQKTEFQLRTEAVNQATQHAEWLRYWLRQLDSAERLDVLFLASAGICHHCGDIVGKEECHCTNDE
jgi:hypothetical protein